MSALADLLRSLDADGERELDALLAEQQQQADALLEAARQEVVATREEAVRAARRRAEERASSLLADAATGARQAVEDAAAAALADVAEAVRARLRALTTDPAGAAATLRLLAEAEKLLPTATACRASAPHRAAVEQAAPTLAVTGGLEDVGVVLTDDRGRTLDNTASTRLGSAWPDLRVVLVTSWREP